MIATINGAVVSGTPEEIQQLITLNNTSVVTASSITESAKKEETPDPYGYGRCEVPVGYAVMREKQAVADYKKRLIKKLKLELGRSTLLAGEQDYVIETIEEVE